MLATTLRADMGRPPGKTSFCDQTDSVIDARDLHDHAGVLSSRVRARLDAEENFEVLGRLLFFSSSGEFEKSFFSHCALLRFDYWKLSEHC